MLASSFTFFELEPDVFFGLYAMEYADTTQEFYRARSEGVRNVLRRATQMATIQWTPTNNVPWNRREFLSGPTVFGIPYSLTQQINKYVGLDVSFHTFMTAVHNPRSVICTDNLGKPRYYVLCDSVGSLKAIVGMTDAEVEKGHMEVNVPRFDDLNCKVVF